MARINIVHVPYKGGPPATAATVGGEVSMLFNTVGSVQPSVKSGRLRALAVTTTSRSGALPDVPTMAEAGLPGFQMQSWFGLLAPAGTPRPIISRLNAETNKALNTPEMKSAIATMGANVMSGSPEQFADHIKSEIGRIGEIVKAAGIKAE
jgi:tripartite-type tricarboxylate transporter receptor subunit TctC